MAYQCPRCGQEVQRGSSAMPVLLGGVVGAVLFSAFGSFECWQCGKISKQEFPPSVRAQITTNAVVLIGGAVALAVVVIGLIALIGAT